MGKPKEKVQGMNSAVSRVTHSRKRFSSSSSLASAGAWKRRADAYSQKSSASLDS